jgi:hypothetical protein
VTRTPDTSLDRPRRLPAAGDDRYPGLGLLLALAGALLVFFLLPFVLGGFRFPLGPDAPVYLWWTRLAGHEGLSAVGERPGVPALLLAISETLRLPLVAVTAGLEVSLGVCVGLAAAALVRERVSVRQRAVWVLEKVSPERDRPEWLLAGLLAGAFSVHLVAGYLSNLAFAVGFLAAGAALAVGTRRGAIAAAGLLGAAGLSHPYFFLIGAAILALTALPSLRAERGATPWRDTEVGRIAIAALGGGAVAATGLLAMLGGPSPPYVETSKDGLLRRAGLTDALASEYRERFLRRWTRYVQWVSIPLGVFGLSQARGFVGRLLRAWGLVTIVGAGASLATGWFPGDRFITFGYVVPILAALGLVRLAHALAPRPVVAGLSAGLLLTLMLVGAGIAWFRQEPFMNGEEVRKVTAAGRYASAMPADSVVKGVLLRTEGESGLFEFARLANVILAALPPDRVRNTHTTLVVSDGLTASPRTDPIHRVSSQSIEEANAFVKDERAWLALVFRAPSSDDSGSELGYGEFVPGVSAWLVPAGRDFDGRIEPPAPVPRPIDPLTVPSSVGIAFASIAVLALIGIGGYGWARVALGEGTSTIALAPAFGLAALTIVGVALERLGVPQTGPIGPTIVTLLAGGSGYVSSFLFQRRAVAEPPPEIEEQPDE